jgi:S1-C subfamily serine protease
MKNKYQVEDLQLKSEQQSKSLTINSMQKSVTSLSLILLGAGITLGIGYLTSRTYSANNPSANNPSASNPAVISAAAAPGTTNTQSNQPSAVPNGMNFIADVARQVSPAVVRINSSRTVAREGGDSFNNPQLRQFFGFPPPEQGKQVERGSGSGFIVNANGRILTNAHVVDGADKVSVVLNDGRRFDGKVLGSDPVTDLAVVQVDATNLPTVSIGNSDQLQPGEWAIAIGNPLGDY